MSNINNFRYIIKNWFSWDKKSIFYFVLKVPISVLQPIITAYIPKLMIDCIEEGIEIKKFICIIVLLSLLVTIITWLEPFMNELLLGSSNRIRMRYSVIAFKKILSMDYSKAERFETRRMYNQASIFYKSLHSPSATFINDFSKFIVCIVGVITSIVLLQKINLTIVFIIFLSCFFEYILLEILKKSELIINEERSSLMVKFYYFYNLSKDPSCHNDIKLYNYENHFVCTVSKIVFKLREIINRYIFQSLKVSSIRTVLNLIRQLICYVYLVYLVCNSKIEISDFVLYFGIISGFSNWIVNLVGLISKLDYCCKTCQIYRVFTEKDSKMSRNSIQLDTIEKIEFNKVSFKHENSSRYTLNNISFKVNKGENIAIIGENGAGKTTLIKLLCGLYTPTSGEIFINGKNIALYSKESCYELFSVVFQDFFFLPTSIAENIAAKNNYDEEKVNLSIERAGLKEVIEALPQKEKSLMIKEIYNNAIELSGGEKQKLLLAKALYKDAPILILDEPTSALDPIAEETMYKKYAEMTKNKITFFISHRLASTTFCDRILFVSNGEIMESGTHKELMDLKGKYYRLFQVQSNYYREKNNNE